MLQNKRVIEAKNSNLTYQLELTKWTILIITNLRLKLTKVLLADAKICLYLDNLKFFPHTVVSKTFSVVTIDHVSEK